MTKKITSPLNVDLPKLVILFNFMMVRAAKSDPKFKLSFTSVPKDNAALTTEIQAFVESDNEDEREDASKTSDAERKASLQQLLRKLYTSICDFGVYRGSATTPDKKITAAWESFLAPINALASLHLHGPLVAARMLLYLARAFIRAGQYPRSLPATDASVRPIALRCHFLISLDNTLLAQLKTLWARSRGRETFAWVFTDYAVSRHHVCENCCPNEAKEGLRNDDDGAPIDWDARCARKEEERFTAACLVAPEDLTPANGVHPVRVWKRPEGDTTPYPQDPEATGWMYSHGGQGDNGSTPRLLMYQIIGSEGPIREDYGYQIIDEDTNESDWRARPVLRRSRQFILDTQKLRVLKERRWLATRALAQGHMPPELVSEVWKYAEPVPEEPYLETLDLCSVYQLFPCASLPVSGRTKPKCDECAKRPSSTAAGKMARATCPRNAIVVWNLPLRAFHTLHMTTNDNWRICKHVPCTGHHDDEDEIENGWAVQTPALEAHLLHILRTQSGIADMTLESARLGPHDPIVLPTEAEDNARRHRLWDREYGNSEQMEAVDEAQWIGLDGLLGVMRQDRVLLGQHPSGSLTTAPSWFAGRTRQEEMRVRAACRAGWHG